MKNRKKESSPFSGFFCVISQITCALDKCYNVKTDSRVAGWDGLYSIEWR